MNHRVNMPQLFLEILQSNGTAAAGGNQTDSGAGAVSFPEDYPNSVKHFLLLGAIGM